MRNPLNTTEDMGRFEIVFRGVDLEAELGNASSLAIITDDSRLTQITVGDGDD
jgi:hypothetical protein